MSVRRTEDGAVELSGACALEDAEPLLQLLIATPMAIVDWRGCESIHAAVLQVLLAADSEMRGPPRGDFLAQVIAPRLRQTAD